MLQDTFQPWRRRRLRGQTKVVILVTAKDQDDTPRGGEFKLFMVMVLWVLETFCNEFLI